MTTAIATSPHKTIIAMAAGLAVAQFTAAYVIGASHLLTNDRLWLFPPIALTIVAPVAVFLLAYGASPGFRALVLSLDIRRLTMLQHWRIIGFVFLPLYAFGVLPGLFAWPAGLGDVAMGLAAPLVIARLDHDPDYQTSAGLVRYHLLGFADFAAAIATSVLASGAFPGLIANGLTSAALDVWPLNIFPSFIVPAFMILQIMVLLKVRHLRRRSQDVENAVIHAV